ncbi:MAG: helix-turn-helix domain-containing protein [Desulfobulbaceae bacterium]|jgi:excisionase family DNA binding protein|nr:helix-turn-helix domain-containing protein [Desulfobulbaceae bacterium]
MKKGFVKRYMTVPEVAEYFSLSTGFIYGLVQKGKLTAWHPDSVVGSRGLRITIESVESLEQNGKIAAEQWQE